jgi:hypothetical protein
MLRAQTKILAVLTSVLIAGCSNAKKAHEVSASYVPAGQYAGMSCDQLYRSAEEIRTRTPALEHAVNESQKNDKIAEQVGWWLFAPALLLMDGNSEETNALANAKGQLEAIRTAAISGQCSGAG